jgi:hypothetical protein
LYRYTTTSVKLEFYCHLPFELAQKEGVMTVSLDVEESIATCLHRFGILAWAVTAAGGVAAVAAEFGDDFEVTVTGENGEDLLGAGAMPLSGSGAVGVADDGEANMSTAAMAAAAKEFEARVGRKPFAVELLKQLS